MKRLLIMLLPSLAMADISQVMVEPQVLIIRGDHLNKVARATINGHKVRIIHRSAHSIELACAAKTDLVCKGWIWKGGECHIELRGPGVVYRRTVYVPYVPPTGGWGAS